MTYFHSGVIFFLTDDRQTNRNNLTPFHLNACLTGEPKSWSYTLYILFTLFSHILYFLFAWFVFREYHLFTVHRQTNRNISSSFHRKRWLEWYKIDWQKTGIPTGIFRRHSILKGQWHYKFIWSYFLWQSLFWFRSLYEPNLYRPFFWWLKDQQQFEQASFQTDGWYHNYTILTQIFFQVPSFKMIPRLIVKSNFTVMFSQFQRFCIFLIYLTFAKFYRIFVNEVFSRHTWTWSPVIRIQWFAAMHLSCNCFGKTLSNQKYHP